MWKDGGGRAGRRVLMAGLVVAALGFVGDRAVVSSESQDAAAESPQAVDSRAAETPGSHVAGGMRVHVDPRTGRPTSAPDAASRQMLEDAMRREMGDALSTSSDGLVEVASPVPGGGVMINLQGRFQSASVASVDGDVVTVDCHGNTPGSGHGSH